MKPPNQRAAKEKPLFPTKEKPVENSGNDYAKSKGWLVYKFVSPGNAGVPDRLYVRCGKVIFVEWKRPSKNPKARARQESQHNRLRRAGVEVYLCNTDDPVTLSLIFD